MSEPIPDLISRYLDGDLGLAERLDFEARMRANPALRAEMAQLVEALASLRRALPQEAPPLRMTLRAMSLAPASGSWTRPLLTATLPRSRQRVAGHQAGRHFRCTGSRMLVLGSPHP